MMPPQPAEPPPAPAAGFRRVKFWRLRCHWCEQLRVSTELFDGEACRVCGSCCFDVEGPDP